MSSVWLSLRISSTKSLPLNLWGVVGKVGAKEGKMEATRDNSKFKGLAVVVEMVMEQNCPASIHQSDGLGCDNMTCILVQFSKTENRDN